MLDWPDVESLATTIAIAVGGIWAYFRFFKGRLAAPRLETYCSSQPLRVSGSVFLITKLDIKNVGPAKAVLKEEACFVAVYGYRPLENIEFLQRTPLDELAVFEILEDHSWIEPGKNVHEELLFSIPNDSPYSAFQLECTVVYENFSRFFKNIEDTVTVVASINEPVCENRKE